MSLLLACFLFVCLFFFMNLARLSLRISPKFQSRTNVPLYSCSFIVTIRLIIVTLSFAHRQDFLWPDSCPIIAQNFAQKSEPKKCLARFSLIYRSIFIAPVRLINVTLSIAHQRDFLWPESRLRLAQNFRTGTFAKPSLIWSNSALIL